MICKVFRLRTSEEIDEVKGLLIAIAFDLLEKDLDSNKSVLWAMHFNLKEDLRNVDKHRYLTSVSF